MHVISLFYAAAAAAIPSSPLPISHSAQCLMVLIITVVLLSCYTYALVYPVRSLSAGSYLHCLQVKVCLWNLSKPPAPAAAVALARCRCMSGSVLIVHGRGGVILTQ